jgi:hypothetical protein
MITKLLEKAFTEASKLPEQEQDSFATWILEELGSERRWKRTFAESQDTLTELAREAIAEYRAGQTQELDPDEL